MDFEKMAQDTISRVNEYPDSGLDRAHVVLEALRTAYNAGRSSLVNDVIVILDGIDKCQTDDEGGWFSTSTGAEFGAGKLSAIRALTSKEG